MLDFVVCVVTNPRCRVLRPVIDHEICSQALHIVKPVCGACLDDTVAGSWAGFSIYDIMNPVRSSRNHHPRVGGCWRKHCVVTTLRTKCQGPRPKSSRHTQDGVCPCWRALTLSTADLTSMPSGICPGLPQGQSSPPAQR